MGERTSYKPGTFSYAELATSDADGAKEFYSALFGWEPEDVPVGDEMIYTMLRLGGKTVGALYKSEQAPHPAWMSYVTVEDADATAARAKEQGANVMTEPFDVMTFGRMAVLQDPTGAVFAAWQPKESIGAQLVNDPGAMSLNQLNTTDVAAAREFYGELFAWRTEQVSSGEQEYWGLYNGDNLNGGMMPMPDEQAQAGVPSHWIVYFTTTDLDESVAKIEELGGQILLPPLDIPGVSSSPDAEPEAGGGRIAVAHDPQGAVFALFEGHVDP
jgi:predicted enzyme related to lactoylglutathione lyase